VSEILLGCKFVWSNCINFLIGIQDFQGVWSKTQIQMAFEKFRHTGDIVWSVKTNVLQPNCVLLNHWSQQAILLTDYTFAGGARGVELVPSTGVQGGNVYEWPSAALDLELTQKKWQPCLVSENIISGQILSMFPKGQSILNRKIT
jgi:hypothetical protein